MMNLQPEIAEKYLTVIKKSLTGSLDTSQPEHWQFNIATTKAFKSFMTNGQVRTLIGPKRLDNIEQSIKYITSNHVNGDIVEAGCWRGGALLYLKACLNVYEEPNTTSRNVWGADLFPESSQLVTSYSKLIRFKSLLKIRKLLPKKSQQRLANHIMEAFPNEQYDKTTLNKIFALANSLTYIKKESLISTSHHDLLEAFKRYDLYDESIKLMPGWFKNTLPVMKDKIEHIALLRIDADFYQSTLDVLNALYPKLSQNGICIIDDYGGFTECQRAVDEYRKQHQITEPLESVDGTCYYWIVKNPIQQ
ncbi:TylF/MycF family methyltransferase [Legionella sp. PATHC038]|uniref:TylF/MycF/NovP-related O-methyltransferase n=1 Tax=Legionella sheltonii TaxID=2992041 RepID=UPI0022437C0C|nr:TylF/MycF/NovP-related O-methyltransferase [Legionella sp. PATHC038]MCW8400769.1 TylF/MycF family methyltransferase [Legionella sp. PATHC038]